MLEKNDPQKVEHGFGMVSVGILCILNRYKP